MPLIELKNIVKTYYAGDTNFNALDNVSLSIERGEFVAIMGASGSGKSTCMNILGTLDKPNSGEYYFDEKLVWVPFTCEVQISDPFIDLLRFFSLDKTTDFF